MARLHKRRHVRSSAPRMTGDWIALVHTLCPADVDVTDICTDPRSTTVSSFVMVDSTDLAAHSDTLTIMRMVGEINLVMHATWESDERGYVHFVFDEMIYLTTEDMESPPTTAVMDPRLSAVMESDNIMWRRRRILTFFKGTVGEGQKFEWAGTQDYTAPLADKIDLKVKRRVKKGDQIIYSIGAVNVVQASTSPVIGQLFSVINTNLWFNMRGYVKF